MGVKELRIRRQKRKRMISFPRFGDCPPKMYIFTLTLKVLAEPLETVTNRSNATSQWRVYSKGARTERRSLAWR